MSIDEIRKNPDLVKTLSRADLVRFRDTYGHFTSTVWLVTLVKEELERRRNEPGN